MSKKKSKKPIKEETESSSFFATYFNKFITGFLALLIGSLGFYLTPLKGIILHSIYEEDATVTLVSNVNHINPGELISIDILMEPTSNIELSDGNGKLIYDESYLKLEEGSQIFNVKNKAGRGYILNGFETKFRGLKDGITKIEAVITTNYNTYRDTLEITIQNAENNDHPTLSNLSGSWTLKLDGKDGNMSIDQKGGKVLGSYNLGEEFGVVSGISDGSISLDLIADGTVKKWRVMGQKEIYEKDGEVHRYLEIKGSAQIYVVRDSGWMKYNSEKHEFYAFAVME